jgi:hypothetical protein
MKFQRIQKNDYKNGNKIKEDIYKYLSEYK